MLATFSVSTANAKLSFSTLKHLKTYLRNTIDQELTGLALLKIYGDVMVDPLQNENKITRRRQQLNLLI
jgi:hypothetical protein